MSYDPIRQYQWVSSAADLPPAVAGVRTLAANTTYYITVTDLSFIAEAIN